MFSENVSKVVCQIYPTSYGLLDASGETLNERFTVEDRKHQLIYAELNVTTDQVFWQALNSIPYSNQIYSFRKFYSKCIW